MEYMCITIFYDKPVHFICVPAYHYADSRDRHCREGEP